MQELVFTDHALYEMRRRGLTREMVKAVISQPEQRWEIRKGRMLFQSRITIGSLQKQYLLRVFVDTDRSPPEVVTAYKTSKIEKYWRGNL